MIETLGQYKILEPAPPGPLGEAYRARDTRAGRTVTITVLCDRIAADPAHRDDFLRDARAATAVSHPNIVTLYEVGEDDGRLFLVHEYVQGETLKSLIGGRPLNPRRALDLAGQMADAIADAHAADLVHGDITAQSVVVTAKGHAKIADFGLAMWKAAVGAADRPAADPGGGYRADMRSLGTILFEMLTGRLPTPGAGVPSAINRTLPREIDPIVGRALGRSGGYESAVTLAAELRAVGAMLDVRKEASDAAAPPQGRSRTRPGPEYARRLVFIAILAAVAAAVWWYVRSA